MTTKNTKTETKHTPGPWRVNEDYASVLANGELGLIASCAPQASRLTSEGGGPVLPEQLANARLISAAPELLEALRGLDVLLSDVACGRFPKPGSLRESDYATAARQVRAAIAKATGKE